MGSPNNETVPTDGENSQPLLTSPSARCLPRSLPQETKDGHQLLASNPKVTQAHRVFVAAVRSTVFVLSFILLLACCVGLPTAIRYHPGPAMSNGNISLCPGDANVSWLGDVSNTYRMVTFIPPPKSGLPNLSYHSSEKSYQLGFRWLQAFSLGLDNPNPMVMHLSWDGAMHCKNRSNVTLYLQTLQSVLVMAGQRASVVPLASPLWSVDGALLLNGSHAWNSISSTWVQYQASSGWVLFMSLFVVCCLFLFISTVQWAYYTFMDDLVDKIMAWLAQCPSHPKLDDLRSLQRRIIKVPDSSQTASTTGTRSATIWKCRH